MKLDLGKDRDDTYSGDATDSFEPSEPFPVLGLQ
jgi:hypothetical protein